MATLKSFKGFIPIELGLGRHYINGFLYIDASNQSYYVQTDNSKAYLVSSDVINYYPDVSFPKVRRLVLDPVEFNLTLDEVIDITEAEVTQHQITNYFSDTLAEAKALTYKKQERVKIFELDEVYECVEVSATPVGYASSAPLQIGADLYFVSNDANTYGQLYKHTGGITTVEYAFVQDGKGTNPVGNLITDGTFIYIETTEGGANSLGTICKYNISTKVLTKILDYSTILGSAKASLLRFVQSLDKKIDNNKLYVMTASGGSNNVGVFLIIDLSNNSVLLTYNLQQLVGQRQTISGVSAIVGTKYYGFHGGRLLIADTTTNTVDSDVLLSTPTPTSVSILTTGFYNSNTQTFYLAYDGTGSNAGFARYEVLTGSYFHTNKNPQMYIIFQDGLDVYGVEWNTNNVYKYNQGANSFSIDATHTLNGTGVGALKLNGGFEFGDTFMYYTSGSGALDQNKIHKYDISAKAITTVYDLQSVTGGATGDDQYLIEIDQSATANLYLRVRDNHLKSIALDATGKGLDVTTTRGATSNIVLPTVNGFDAYNTDIFTGGTGDQTTLTANTISDMVLTNSAPALTSSDFLPNGIEQIYDFTNNRLDFGSAGLSATSTLTLDFSYLFNQDDDDSILDFIIEFTENNGSTFTKELSVGFTDEGAGQDIEQVTRVSFFIGPSSTLGTAVIKLRSDADALFTLKTLTIYTHI